MSQTNTKDSGVAWIGAVPEHWRIVRLGSIFTERKQTVSDEDYPALSVTMKGIVPQLATAAKSDAGDKRKLVKQGDFVINSRSDRKGSAGIAPTDGSVSQISIVLEPRGVDPRYIGYLLTSYPFQEEFYRWGTGIVADLWSTRFSAMKQILLPVPPLEEQRAIAEYLDATLMQLNDAGFAAERLSAQLNQRFQALIDDRIWDRSSILEPGENIQLRRLVNFVTKRTSSPNQVMMDQIKSFWGIRTTLDSDVDPIQDTVNEETVETTGFQSGDVLFGKLRPYLAKAWLADSSGVAVGDIYVLRPNGIPSIFLKWLMLSPRMIQQIDASSYGTKMPRANWDFMRQIEVPNFNHAEAESIGEELETESKRVLQILNSVQQLLTTIHLQRQALTSAAVTGRIALRGISNG